MTKHCNHFAETHKFLAVMIQCSLMVGGDCAVNFQQFCRLCRHRAAHWRSTHRQSDRSSVQTAAGHNVSVVSRIILNVFFMIQHKKTLRKYIVQKKANCIHSTSPSTKQWFSTCRVSRHMKLRLKSFFSPIPIFTDIHC